jgi:hypothetical protein
MHRKDANHDDLVSLARKLDIYWFDGPPLDGWAGIGGRWYPVEIKMPEREGRDNEFTEQQTDFFANCRLFGTRFLIWRREVDVFNDYKELAK